MATDKTVTFGVKIEAESNAPQAAQGVEKLQEELARAQSSVKQAALAMRNLRGNTDAVKEAKKKLAAVVAAERDKITQSTLALLKQNAALTRAKKETAEYGSIIKSAISRLLHLKGAAGSTAQELLAETGSIGLAAGLAVGAIALMTGAALAGAAAIAKWSLEAADTRRTQNLLNEAALGGAENAAHMSNQIDLLVTKVPQSRAELATLATTLSRSFNDTRISGEGLVATFEAVARSSAAMGDQAGSKIKEIADRSKMWGRMGIGFNELQGTGFNRDDVATALAERLHIGFNQARQQLALGRVNVNDGMQAINDVVNKKFGGINSKQMLSLSTMTEKFKDQLKQLASGIDLGPLSRGLGAMLEMFNQNTITGSVMKQTITDFGNAVGLAIEKAVPFVRNFVDVFQVEMLKFELLCLEAAVFIKEKFGLNITKTFDDMKISTNAAIVIADTFKVVLVAAGAAAALAAAEIKYISDAIDAIGFAINKIEKYFKADTWKQLGSNVVDGIISGLLPGRGEMDGAGGMLADGLRKAFRAKLDMHSPSRAFQRDAKNVAPGIVRGVDGGLAEVEGAGKRLGGATLGGFRDEMKNGASRGGGNTHNVMNLTANVHVAGGSQGAVEALTSQSFKAQLLKALEEMAIQAGLAPQTARSA